MTEISKSSKTAEPESDAAVRIRETDEIYKGIGRNVVLLQQIEKMLRYLVANADVAGPTSDLTVQRDAVAKTWKKASLGKLDEEFRSRVFSDKEEEPSLEAFAVRVRFPTSPEEKKTRSKQLRRVVKERNKLVHRLPFDWIPGRAQGYLELSAWLELIWHENLPLWTELKRQVSMLRTIDRFLGNPEASNLLFTSIPDKLADAANQSAEFREKDR
jgi:hypothetical protein